MGGHDMDKAGPGCMRRELGRGRPAPGGLLAGLGRERQAERAQARRWLRAAAHLEVVERATGAGQRAWHREREGARERE